MGVERSGERNCCERRINSVGEVRKGYSGYPDLNIYWLFKVTREGFAKLSHSLSIKILSCGVCTFKALYEWRPKLIPSIKDVRADVSENPSGSGLVLERHSCTDPL